MAEKIQKSEAEWRASLTDEQYRVARLKGTERAFTGAYWNSKDDGLYEVRLWNRLAEFLEAG
jgi:peptide-methionine (R)-S-oxide reductase